MYLKAMFGLNRAPVVDTEVMITVQNHLWLLLIAFVAATPLPVRIHRMIAARTRPAIHAVYLNTLVPFGCLTLLAISAVLLVGRTYTPFFYFRF